MNELITNGTTKTTYRRTHKVLAMIMLVVFGLFQTAYAQDFSSNINVIDGDVVIHDAAGNVVDVDVLTDNATVDWLNGFNIPEGWTINFNQLSASSKLVNLDTSGSISSILGAMNAIGNIWIINPCGVFFGPNASINVGGLLASGLPNTGTDFSANALVFGKNDEGGYVINKGEIKVSDGGSVTLLGKEVHNDGVIQAKLGKVTLASGEKMTLEMDSQGTISVAIEDEVTEALTDKGSAITNAGSITADGGTVLMTASVLGDVFTNAINNTGVIQATSLESKNGEVYLTANDRVATTGTIKTNKLQVDAEGITTGGLIVAENGTYNANDGDTNISGTYVGDQTWTDNENIYVDADLNVDGTATFVADLDTNGSGDFTLLDTFEVFCRGLDITAENIFFGADSYVTVNGSIVLYAQEDIVQYGGAFLAGRRVANITPGTLTGSLTENQWYNHDTDGYSDGNLPEIDFQWEYSLDESVTLSFNATCVDGSYVMYNGASVNTNGGNIELYAENGWLHIANGPYRGLLNAGQGTIYLSLGKNLAVNNCPPAVFRANDGTAGVIIYVDNNLSQNVKPEAFDDGSSDPIELAFDATFTDGTFDGLVGPITVLVDNGDGTGIAGTTATATAESATWVFEVTDNVSPAESLGNYMFDWTAPDVSAFRITEANVNGWNNTNVSLTYNATDNLSGVDNGASDSKPYTMTSEGASQSHTFTVYDEAGNAGTGTVEDINIDKTAPTINADIVTNGGAANGDNGWFVTDVDSESTASDGLSGLDATTYEYSTDGATWHAYTSPDDITTSADGSATVYFRVNDLAGNSNNADVSFKIDQTDPTINANIVTNGGTANGNNGWFVTDVDSDSTASDATSGIDSATYEYSTDGGSTWHAYTSPNDITVSADGSATVEFRVADEAGNTNSAQVSFKIDQTAPDVNAYRLTLANIYGWNNTDVDVTYDATDATSGVDAAASDAKPYTFTSEGINQGHTFTVYDMAGNSGTGDIAGINIDKTAPVITATRSIGPNANGWNNTPVTVTYNGTDNLSGINYNVGIEDVGPVQVLFAPSGTDLSPDVFDYECTGESGYAYATDYAGNRAEVYEQPINIDWTAPIITPTVTPPPVQGVNESIPVTVSYQVSDERSGIDPNNQNNDYGDDVFDVEGPYYAEGVVYDKAGNAGRAGVEGYIQVPEAAPIIPITEVFDLRFRIGRQDIVEGTQVSFTQGYDSLFTGISQVYLYHPIVEMSMYEVPMVAGVDMYQFIDGALNATQPQLLPGVVQDDEKDKKKK